MVRWLRWHCPPDTGFEIRALAVWGRARYLSVTEAPHNTNFHTWMGKKQFCFFQIAETGNPTPDSGVKGSGANHYPRAPALDADIAYVICQHQITLMLTLLTLFESDVIWIWRYLKLTLFETDVVHVYIWSWRYLKLTSFKADIADVISTFKRMRTFNLII